MIVSEVLYFIAIQALKLCPNFYLRFDLVLRAEVWLSDPFSTVFVFLFLSHVM